MNYTVNRSFDVELIEGMDAELFPDSYRITDEHNSYWVAWNEGGHIGYAAACGLREESQDPLWMETAFMSRVGVYPSARRQGLQKMFIELYTLWAIDRGYKRLATYVAWGNTPSLRAFVQSGFVPYVPEYYWAGDVIYLEKDLEV